MPDQIYLKRNVDYRDGEEPEVCKNCVYFLESPRGISLFASHKCEIVDGRIKGSDVCNLWSPNEDTEEE